MKIKRYKQARRVLDFYKRNFSFHEPYQIIVDGPFTQAALKGKIQLKEQLPKYFGGEIKLVTTACVISELQSLGKQLGGAVFVAKRFQLRSCGHGKKGMTATECIQSLIGEGNPHHYFVASQDPELRGELRKRPGVPLLHIIRNTIVLEKPTVTSQHKAEELVEARVQPTEYQKEVLDQLEAATGEDQEAESKKRKRRRPKGPNPLSVKKSKKMRQAGSSGGRSSKGSVSKNMKRRQRLQMKRAIQSLGKLTISTHTTSTTTTTAQSS